MLYKVVSDKFDLELMPYLGFEDLSKKEKDLEDLLAKHLSDIYAEDGQLMPIFQERAWQEEPDLCALDKDGNLVIFELKRGIVPGDTTIQVMRYAQIWGQKTYSEIEASYKMYCESIHSPFQELREAHKEAFGLEKPLEHIQFNNIQRLIIVGSSSDTNLIEAVDYWKSKGMLIDFIPYRVYKINSEYYFEFFSKPYDTHINPSKTKGIIFDTNRTYNEQAIWDMIKNRKISAYGSTADAVNSFNKGDYVFYYHTGYGIVAAGIIKSDTKENHHNQEEVEKYRDVDFLTPSFDVIKEEHCISSSELRALLNKGFYLAKTTKVPYLTTDECKQVIECLKNKFET